MYYCMFHSSSIKKQSMRSILISTGLFFNGMLFFPVFSPTKSCIFSHYIHLHFCTCPYNVIFLYTLPGIANYAVNESLLLNFKLTLINGINKYTCHFKIMNTIKMRGGAWISSKEPV
jgi:hypothetical protein